MRRNLQVIITALLLFVCPVSRGEESIDADTLIARILERVDYLEALYDKGVDVEYEKETVTEGDESPAALVAHRVVCQGLFEMDQRKYLSEFQDSTLIGGVEEFLTIRNPRYSFVLKKEKASVQYSLDDLYNDRDGVLPDQILNGLFTNTAESLVGLYVAWLSLREILCSDTFEAESIEKNQDQYRLVFKSDILIDKCNRLLRGELYVNAEDYSLEGWEVVIDFALEGWKVDTGSITGESMNQWTDRTIFTYGDWQGLKYPKSIEEHEYHDIGQILHHHTTIRSFHVGPPNKEEFYLKYYGIDEPTPPRNPPSPTVFIVVGILLIGAGIYLKRRAATGSAESK